MGSPYNRKSSEAPEVVPQTTDKHLITSHVDWKNWAQRKRASHLQKEVAGYQDSSDGRPRTVESYEEGDTRRGFAAIPNSPPPMIDAPPYTPTDESVAYGSVSGSARGSRTVESPSAGGPSVPGHASIGGPSMYDLSPNEAQRAVGGEKKRVTRDLEIVDEKREDRKKKRTFCGLPMWFWFVLLAFIIGGAIGGGVGGGLASKNSSSDSKSASSENPPESSASSASPTSTNSPAISSTTSGTSSTSTVTVDAAGCPISNGTTYISPATNNTEAATFQTYCGADVFPVDGRPIDIDNSAQDSWEACLDFCANWDEEARPETGKCITVTWVIFSRINPGRNGRCYMKNETGAVRDGIENGQVLVSGFMES